MVGSGWLSSGAAGEIKWGFYSGVVTLDVSQEALMALLAQGSESPVLEFVADCDLSDRRAVVELATEVGALAARGGSLIVGVNDHGQPVEMLSGDRAARFDEANLRNVLSQYLPSSIDLRVSIHEVGARPVVLIQVGEHPDGAVVFLADGAYEDKQHKTRFAFRKGEFFVRHGTKSELPAQDDIGLIARHAVERERLWLTELRGLEEAISAIGDVNDAEWFGDPNARVGALGVPTRLPTARAQLAGRLASFSRLGGPDMPHCQELATGTKLIYRSGVFGLVYNAMAEIARLRDRAPS